MSGKTDHEKWKRRNRTWHAQRETPWDDDMVVPGGFHPGIGDHGKCALCPDEIVVGDYVKVWKRASEGEKRVLVHVACARKLT